MDLLVKREANRLSSKSQYWAEADLSEYKELIFISPAFFNQNYFCLSCHRHFYKGKDKVSGLRLLWGAIAETAEALEVSL